jgi:hypothetical protein
LRHFLLKLRHNEILREFIHTLYFDMLIASEFRAAVPES